MKTAYLSRTEQSDHGMFGHFYCEALHLHSGELPWLNNKRGLSCIPADTYIVKWEPTGKFKGYVIQDVPERDSIEIHVANWFGDRRKKKKLKSDVLGCVGLGLSRGIMNKQEALISSRAAMRKFHTFMKEETFKLIIEDKFNEEEES